MLRKRSKMLLIFTLYTIVIIVVSTVIGLYTPVLLCDVWQMGWGICR